LSIGLWGGLSWAKSSTSIIFYRMVEKSMVVLLFEIMRNIFEVHRFGDGFG
jgi:hypothetical protein